MKKFLFCLLLAVMVIYPLSVDAFPLKTDILGSEPNGVMYDDRWERDDDDWWDDDRYEDEDDDWWDDDRYEDDDDDDWDDDRWDD